MATSNRGVTSINLSQQFGITQTTSLMFKYKVQSVMGSIAPPKLQGDVGIGFFDIQAEYEDDYSWMMRKSKRRILLAIEVKDRKVVKAICRIVDDIKPDYARQIINECVSPTAHLTIADGGVRGFKKMATHTPLLSVLHNQALCHQRFDKSP